MATRHVTAAAGVQPDTNSPLANEPEVPKAAADASATSIPSGKDCFICSLNP
jgi:hypothetical protein